VPGALLDNNTVERAVIGNANPDFTLALHSQVNWNRFDISFLVRAVVGQDVFNNTSLVYATEDSAAIASVLTSLIATCLHAGVNALAYLVAVQEQRTAVFRDPAAWVPWRYHATLVPPSSSCVQSSAIWA